MDRVGERVTRFWMINPRAAVISVMMRNSILGPEQHFGFGGQNDETMRAASCSRASLRPKGVRYVIYKVSLSVSLSLSEIAHVE